MFGCLSRVGGQSVRGGDPWEVVVRVFDEHLDRAVPGEVVQCVPEHVLVEERVAPVREEPREPGILDKALVSRYGRENIHSHRPHRKPDLVTSPWLIRTRKSRTRWKSSVNPAELV